MHEFTATHLLARRVPTSQGKLRGNMSMDANQIKSPTALEAILEETTRIGFTQASVRSTGSLLRTLVCSKPGGLVLELGTGTGAGTAWLLDGMDENSTLITIEKDEERSAVAQQHLGSDPRATFYVGDAATVLPVISDRRFDMIFADTWIGKFIHLDEVLDLLNVGGLYVNDDMKEQPNWPDDRESRDAHLEKVYEVISSLKARTDLVITYLDWASGLVIATKRAALPGVEHADIPLPPP
ncbi:O-methyltransferase [Xanthomonas translucens]|nr:class I SAM-dependent methyltransferase [Xanthomonas translucens]